MRRSAAQVAAILLIVTLPLRAATWYIAPDGDSRRDQEVAKIPLGRRPWQYYLNTQHATGSRAFTENIRKLVGSRASAQFKYFNNYGQAVRNDIDILFLDEAHRLRPNSFSR